MLKRLSALAFAFIAVLALCGFVTRSAVRAAIPAPVASVTAPPASSDEKPEAGDTADAGDTTTIGASGDTTTTGASEQSEEKLNIEFVLFKKLKKVDAKGWIFFGSALALAAVIIVYLANRKKDDKQISTEKKANPTLMLVHGALCIALSFVLSYIKLFSMPLGGSVTLASMLPLMIYANRYGLKWGILAGAVYGVLQYVQNPQGYHWTSFLLEYPVAFAMIGLGGCVKGIDKLLITVLIGGFARFVMHFIDGVIFFGENGVGLGSNIWASLSYNAPYMFADIAICAVIALIPAFRKAIKRALKY